MKPTPIIRCADGEPLSYEAITNKFIREHRPRWIVRMCAVIVLALMFIGAKRWGWL